MRNGVSVKRLRWGLLASAALLLTVLAAYLLYGHFRTWRLPLPKGGTLIHETDGYTYSQTVKGRTIFTLHAAKAVQRENGVWALHDVILTFFGSTGNTVDHVYGHDFEYDEKQGVATALGDVDMDLEPPPSVGGEKTTTDNNRVMHVKTRGLHYIRSLGVAATEERVEFQYGGLRGSSQGAEFYNGQNLLHLLASVEMSGDVHGRPMNMTARTADLDRINNVATFTAAEIHSEDKTGKADYAIVYLRKDSSVDKLEATNNVVLDEGTRSLSASRLDATMGPTSLLQTAKLSVGVTLVDTNTQRPAHGAARQVDVTFDAKGSPEKIVATSAARFSILDKRNAANALRREIHGNQIVLNFVSSSSRGAKQKSLLSSAHASGNAGALADSLTTSGREAVAALKTTTVTGDDLLANFSESVHGQAELKSLLGHGHTMLQQDAPLGAQQQSFGDTLTIGFATGAATTGKPDAQKITTAIQSGHVTICLRAAAKPGAPATDPAQVTTASADHASYDGATEKLTLADNAHLSDGSTELSANTVVMDQKTGDAEAHGRVMASMQSAAKTNLTPANVATPVTHVLADDASLHHDTKVAHFRGTDAHPARLWQDASQVEAADLLFDGTHKTLSARPAASAGIIHAVFAGQPKMATTTPGTHASPAANVVRIASQKMDYSDTQREAVFAGSVQIDGISGSARSQRAVVFLSPTSKPGATSATPLPNVAATAFGAASGSVEKVVLTGEVQLQQPGRTGTGGTLFYTASSGSYVLTGSPAQPPRVVDAQQGTVTGATLLFSDAGSTIIVAGQPASAKGKRSRVRTETEVRPEGK